MIPPAVAASIEIQLPDGTWLPLSLVETFGNDGNVEPPTLPSQLSALLADIPLGQKLHSQMWANRGLGIGLDYNIALGLYTRTPGIVVTAGAATALSVIGAWSSNNNPLVAIEEFGVALFIAQEGAAASRGGTVIRSSDGTGAGGGAFAPVTFGHADYAAHPTYLTPGEYIRDLCLFGDGTGTRYLYASSSDVNGLNGRLHRTTDGVNWTSTNAATFGTNGRGRMKSVLWTGRDNLSWPRLFTISGPNKISYTKVGADPFLAASWIEGVEIDTAKTLLDLGAARRHVWMRAQDNTFDVDEYGESIALMAHDSEVSAYGSLQFLRDNLYVASGRTLNRIYVGDTNVTVQESAQHCFPGWGTPAENDLRGFITAMCPDQGDLVAAIYNPSVVKSFICWGSDQGVPQGNRNPLIWFGPEAFADQAYVVTRMKTSGLAGDLRLWVCSQTVAGSAPALHWISLPISGAPLQDLISGGGMRFANGSTGAGCWNTSARLELLPTDWNGTAMILDQAVALTRGLSIVRAADGTTTNDGIGTKLTLEQVADPSPGAITWPSGVDVTTTPSQVVMPPATKKGERLWQRLKFFNPNGGATPAKIGVLDAMRIDYWIVSPTAIHLDLTVQYGAGIRSLANTEYSDRDPDWVTSQLTSLTSLGRTNIKLRDGKGYTVKFEQVQEISTIYTSTGGYSGKVVTARLSVLVLGQAF